MARDDNEFDMTKPSHVFNWKDGRTLKIYPHKTDKTKFTTTIDDKPHKWTDHFEVVAVKIAEREQNKKKK